MKIRSMGIDLGKTIFHLVALGDRGKILLKKLSRKQLLALTANLPGSLIGLEACSGSHFLARALREQGHEARLIPAQFVKPFLKSNKNDVHPRGPGCGRTTPTRRNANGAMDGRSRGEGCAQHFGRCPGQ